MTPPTKFVTIPEVVLAKVGKWKAGTGLFDCTAEDLADAVRASKDGGFWAPRGKIGEKFAHDPKGKAVGRFENLRLSDDGNALVADHVCVPADFAASMPSDYPSRSIEAGRNVTSDATGETFRLALRNVELLGVDGPAVKNLPDITPEQVAAAFDVAASDAVEGTVVSTAVHASTITITDDDVRRAWNEQHPAKRDEPGTWVMEIGIEPRTVVVEDGDEHPLRVEWSHDASGAITFGKSQRVQRGEWVPVDDTATVSASAAVRVYTSRLESRPAHESTEEHMPDPALIRKALGLDAEATDEQLEAAIVAAAEAVDKTTEEPVVEPVADPVVEPVAATAALPEGTVLLSAGQLETLQAQAAAGQKASETLQTQEDDKVLASAALEGRITAGEQDAMRARLQVPELRESTIVLLTAAPADGGLVPGAVPVTPAGSPGTDEVHASADEDATYNTAMQMIAGGDA